MAIQLVEFRYYTGLKRAIFRQPILRGSWDAAGRHADVWTDRPMEEAIGEDGCPMFRATVALDLADVGRTFQWGVALDGPQGSHFWGIPTELSAAAPPRRYREFTLGAVPG
jgi:1,4-alpha-glucan branching enzyme